MWTSELEQDRKRCCDWLTVGTYSGTEPHLSECFAESLVVSAIAGARKIELCDLAALIHGERHSDRPAAHFPRAWLRRKRKEVGRWEVISSVATARAWSRR